MRLEAKSIKDLFFQVLYLFLVLFYLFFLFLMAFVLLVFQFRTQ